MKVFAFAAICISALAFSVNAGSIKDGLLYYYPFETHNGNKVTPSVGPAYYTGDGASAGLPFNCADGKANLVIATTYVSGKANFGKNISGGNAGGYIGGRMDTRFAPGTENWSLSIWTRRQQASEAFPIILSNGAWPKIEAVTNSMTISLDEATTLISGLPENQKEGWGLFLVGGNNSAVRQVVFRCFDTVKNLYTLTTTTTVPAAPTPYIHFVVTREGNLLSLYKDGVCEATCVLPASCDLAAPITETAQNYFRTHGNGVGANSIDDLAFWNRALSPSEVLSISLANTPLSEVDSWLLISIYERTLSGTEEWETAAWTINGVPNQAFTLQEGTAAAISLSVAADAEINFPLEALSSAQLLRFQIKTPVFDPVTLSFTYDCSVIEDLPSTPETGKHITPFGRQPEIQNNNISVEAILKDVPEGYKAAYTDGTITIAKIPSARSISVKMGPRTESLGFIKTYHDATGAYPVQGSFWNNTPPSASGVYQGTLPLLNSFGESTPMNFIYYAPNTWKNNDKDWYTGATTGNGVLTSSYVDDGELNGELNVVGEGGEVIAVLPAAPEVRGWQVRLDNIPYEMYDLYFILASDTQPGQLEECPVAISLDNGANWTFYSGDSVNNATISGKTYWNATPQTNGPLTEGKNYLRIRVSKALFGENISTIDITHALRNTQTTPSRRSGLAGIQIVEADSDGVYIRESIGNWTDAAWTTNGESGQNWRNATESDPVYAKINAENVPSLSVNQNVVATSVVLTGTSDFSLSGSGILVAPNVDATGLNGNFTLTAPVTGTVATDTLTAVVLPVDAESLRATRFTGTGSLSKTGNGTLTQTGDVNLRAFTQGQGETVIQGKLTVDALTVNSGTLTSVGAANTTGTITVDGGTLRFIGPATIGGSFAVSGDGVLAFEPAAGNTQILNTALQGENFTKIGEGTLQFNTTPAYTGTTTVSEGTLVFNANMRGINREITISPGATLRIDRGVNHTRDRLPRNGIITVDGGTLALEGTNSLPDGSGTSGEPASVNVLNEGNLLCDLVGSDHIKMKAVALTNGFITVGGTKEANAKQALVLSGSISAAGNSALRYANGANQNNVILMNNNTFDIAEGGVLTVGTKLQGSNRFSKTGTGEIRIEHDISVLNRQIGISHGVWTQNTDYTPADAGKDIFVYPEGTLRGSSTLGVNVPVTFSGTLEGGENAQGALVLMGGLTPDSGARIRLTFTNAAEPTSGLIRASTIAGGTITVTSTRETVLPRGSYPFLVQTSGDPVVTVQLDESAPAFKAFTIGQSTDGDVTTWSVVPKQGTLILLY